MAVNLGKLMTFCKRQVTSKSRGKLKFKAPVWVSKLSPCIWQK
jgi:hypothetical protein